MLWPMIGLAFGVHLVLLLAFSPRLFTGDETSPERLFEKGEQEMARGNYDKAMEFYQKVMDQQPKVPPVFEKAAEQHRSAERLRNRLALPEATTKPAPSMNDPLTAATKPAPATKPATRPVAPATKTSPGEFVPPELR